MLDHLISSDLMYRLLVQSVQDYAIFLLDMDGTILNWNAGAERTKGYSANEIVGRNYACFFSDEDQATALPRLNLETTLQKGHYTAEGWRVRKDGTAFWARVAIDLIRDDHGKAVGFAKVTRDLTEIRESARLLEYQAMHDVLTGTLNRAGIVERLAARSELGIAVHYIDLDRFKPVNDTFGHHVGDEVLREVARRLEALVGTSGVVGRLGGDEFVILQSGAADREVVSAMAEAALNCLLRPIRIEEKAIMIGASIGIAIMYKDGHDASSLLRSADLALYRAKGEGGQCVHFFEPEMSAQALARNLLELKLRHATEAGDFQLAYQPIVNGLTNETIGFEALMRWTDQAGQAVAPAVFIPLAEEIGLMPTLGIWALETACREAATWSGDLKVSVNLSALQLKQKDLTDIVASILKDTGLPAHRLELEITETAVLNDLKNASLSLTSLRALGVGIALDDFGTGFSSLSLVNALPLTRIKIDRSFVTGIDGSRRSIAIAEAVVALCQGLGISTTAEGIETEGQRDALLRSGCTDLQGYLYGRPTLTPFAQCGSFAKACTRSERL